jgi:hypothetical protein
MYIYVKGSFRIFMPTIFATNSIGVPFNNSLVQKVCRHECNVILLAISGHDIYKFLLYIH